MHLHASCYTSVNSSIKEPIISDFIVTYKIREDPDDAQSDVLLKHRLHITQVGSSMGSNVTWSIDKLTFIQPGGDSWTDDKPGLSNWVVTHADPQNPVAGDFTSPPAMSGGAGMDGGGAKLTYDFTPGSCGATERAMYGGDVVCAQYEYVAGTTTIAEEDEDEPAETDLENPPS